MNFNTDERGFVIVYTDGSCLNNGMPGAYAGIGVYYGKDHPLNVSKPLVGKPTNNRAEIHAALAAINIALELKIEKLRIRSDSEYVVKSMTVWMMEWLAHDWCKFNGDKVLNREDFEKLNEAKAKLTVEWEHVPAHVGIEGNEGAHNLAVEGANMSKSNDQLNEPDSSLH